MTDRPIAALDALFRPASVAIFGASRSPDKPGHATVVNLARGGYAGRIYPINPAGGEIAGIACRASLADLPEAPDCAMLVIPAEAAVAAVRACAEAGVKVAIVGASGFAEAGTAEGRARQAEIAAIAAGTGMRLVGPNTNGVFNATDRLSLGYNSTNGDPFAAGAISVASHSGALFGGFARSLRGLGRELAKFVPVGNEADLDLLDFLEFFIADPATSVIGLIVEALPDGARFGELAARARAAGKPVAVLRIGRTRAGAGAALAHSSRLAGSARAYDALFRAAGVAQVTTVEALAGAAALLEDVAARPAGAGAGLGGALVCVTGSGAGGALVADHAADRGLALAGDGTGEWRGRLARRIAALPAVGPVRNPVDVGALGDWRLLDQVFDALAEDGELGPTVAFSHIAPGPTFERAFVAAVTRRKSGAGALTAVLAPGGLRAETERQYLAAGIPVFHDTAVCLDAVACCQAWVATPAPAPAPAPPGTGPALPAEIGQALRAAAAAGRGVLDEAESARVLGLCGIAMVESRQYGSLGEAREAAEGLSYPVVLKAMAPGLVHKRAHGLVATRIADAAGLRAAAIRIGEHLAALGHGGEVATLVQPMIAAEAEIILGVSHEPPLGHFLLAGLGGILAEALDEVILLPIPAGADPVRRRIAESRLGAVLAAVDAGGGALDRIVAMLSCLERLVLAHGGLIETVDLNPVLVGTGGVVAVDAALVLRAADTAAAT